MKIESTKTYKVEKYTAKTDWTDCGYLGGDDVKDMIKGMRFEKEMSEIFGEMIFRRSGSTTMINVKEVK